MSKTSKDVKKEETAKFLINGNSVGLIVVGLLVLNVLGPVTNGLGMVLAFKVFELIGVI